MQSFDYGEWFFQKRAMSSTLEYTALNLISTFFYYYHWVDISAGGLSVPKDIILPVASAWI
jgi:hypothetical protein